MYINENELMKMYSNENVLLKYYRMQLGVGSKAPGPAVLGECGRHSVYVYYYIRCIKYWLRLGKSRNFKERCILRYNNNKFILIWRIKHTSL